MNVLTHLEDVLSDYTKDINVGYGKDYEDFIQSNVSHNIGIYISWNSYEITDYSIDLKIEKQNTAGAIFIKVPKNKQVRGYKNSLELIDEIIETIEMNNTFKKNNVEQTIYIIGVLSIESDINNVFQIDYGIV